MSQLCQRFLSVSEGGADYIIVSDYQAVQNGIPPTQQPAFDPTYRFMRMGRDLAAYTHVDVLSQRKT